VSRKHKRIAKFKDGKFETNDPILIEKLKKHYRWEESPKVVSNLVNFLKLKKEAIQKGVYKKEMKKKDIEKALEEFGDEKGKTENEGNKNPQDESLKK